MAYAFVSEVSNGASASGTVLTLSITYAAGEKGIIRVGWGSNTNISRTVSDGTNTYTLAAELNGTGSAGESHAVYVCDNPTAGNYTLTVTMGSSVAFREVSLMRYTGLSTGFQVVGKQQQSAQGTGTDALTTGTITPTLQPAALIGWSQSLNNNAVNAGTGFTSRGTSTTSDTANGVKTRLMDARLTSTSNTALTATTTTDSGFYFTVGIVVSEPIAAACVVTWG